MKISILVDNIATQHTFAEHGLSYFIEYDGKKILFDTGQSDLFIRNAEIMNVDLSKLDYIVLSHGHFDHGNGLSYLESGKLICHPGCFIRRYRASDRSYIGLSDTKEKLAKKFSLFTTELPFKITDKIIFSGSIPRLTTFEARSTEFIFEDGSPDFVMDDTALFLLLKEGLFVITGCGHSGIVNTLEHAVRISGEKRIYGVMGGFHLKTLDNQTKAVISYLEQHNVEHVYPSHCTSPEVRKAFYKAFACEELKSGKLISFL